VRLSEEPGSLFLRVSLDTDDVIDRERLALAQQEQRQLDGVVDVVVDGGGCGTPAPLPAIGPASTAAAVSNDNGSPPGAADPPGIAPGRAPLSIAGAAPGAIAPVRSTVVWPDMERAARRIRGGIARRYRVATVAEVDRLLAESRARWAAEPLPAPPDVEPRVAQVAPQAPPPVLLDKNGVVKLTGGRRWAEKIWQNRRELPHGRAPVGSQSCLRKRGYQDEGTAEKFARMTERDNPGRPMHSYKCPSCSSWHVGSLRAGQ